MYRKLTKHEAADAAYWRGLDRLERLGLISVNGPAEETESILAALSAHAVIVSYRYVAVFGQ